jgi:hypothetical protein
VTRRRRRRNLHENWRAVDYLMLTVLLFEAAYLLWWAGFMRPLG